MWKRNILGCLSHTPTRNTTRKRGMWPDPESNPQPFGVQDDAPKLSYLARARAPFSLFVL